MGENESTSQVPLRELPTLAASLREAITRMPAPEKTRGAAEEAMSAECVQCAIKLKGADVLALPDGKDPRFERIRQGYCARNGCDCHFYKVTRAAHPDLDWAQLLSATTASIEGQAAITAAQTTAARKRFLKAKAVRIGIAIAALAAVYIARQLYMGGRIPFIREPENFQVDKVQEPEQFEVDRSPQPPPQQPAPSPKKFQVDRKR